MQYAVPDNFSLEDWQQSAFGVYHSGTSDTHTVRIRFAKESARYVQEGFWHSSQQFEPHPNGAVILTMQVNDFAPVIKWILSFDRNAVALEPNELVAEIQADLNHMQAAYMLPQQIPK